MDNNKQNLRAGINEAAVELARMAADLEFEDAQQLIKNFVQYQSLADGHPKIVIGSEDIQSIRIDHIPKTLTFVDAVELASGLYGAVTGNLFLGILGGLFLVRSLYKLSQVKLSPVDSLMVMALLNSKRDEGFTDDEWLTEVQKEEKYRIKISRNFGRTQLIERAKVLEALKAVELVEGKWRFSDEIVFR